MGITYVRWFSPAMSPRLNIASVCRTLPTTERRTDGVFIARRIEAMSERAAVRVLQPVPYFPVVRPLPGWARKPTHESGKLTVEHAPMFYLPGVLKSLDGHWLSRAIRRRIEKIHSRRKLDAIEAHFGYPDGFGAVRAGMSLGIPVFITVRGVEAEYLKNRSIGPKMLGAFSQADGCICVSFSLARMLRDRGIETDKIRVIPNAVNRSVFRPRSKDHSRAMLGVDGSIRLIVSVGNLLAVKRHADLIKAFSQVKSECKDAQLVIIGGVMHEPSYPSALRELVKSMRLVEDVSFPGQLESDDIATWLSAADVFSLASEREGCCNALLEALACGTPAVVTDVGDNARFVRHGENGFLVPVGDVDSLSAAQMMALKSSRWNRDEISAELSVGSWGSVADKVIDFMRERIQIREKEKS